MFANLLVLQELLDIRLRTSQNYANYFHNLQRTLNRNRRILSNSPLKLFKKRLQLQLICIVRITISLQTYIPMQVFIQRVVQSYKGRIRSKFRSSLTCFCLQNHSRIMEFINGSYQLLWSFLRSTNICYKALLLVQFELIIN